MQFPMYVVTVPDLLRMTEARPHQVLKKEGVLRRYDRSLGPAAFVSHQWCSSKHPDPRMEQLSVLQRALRRLASNNLRIEVNLTSLGLYKTKPSVTVKDVQPLCSGCVWYDYFAVPQPYAKPADGTQAAPADSESRLCYTNIDSDTGKAVFCIPTYVEACQLFLVLAPPVPHAEVPDCFLDYRSWQDRGWCRLERFARTLSPLHTHILLVSREDTLFQTSGDESLVDPVGEGVFTIEADRARIAPVMVMLMERKLQLLLEKNKLHEYRRTLGMRNNLLRGLPGVSPRSVFAPGFKVADPVGPATGQQMAAAFLRLYGFRTVFDRAEKNVHPITFAARDTTLQTIQALLECRADMRSREVVDEPEYLCVRGSTLLHDACVNAEGASMVRFLVERRADMEARSAPGITPLMSAAFCGRGDVVAALLDMKASMSSTMPLAGMTALHLAALRGRPQICAQLIQAGAAAAPCSEGVSPILLCAMLGGGRRAIEVVLAAPDSDFERPVSVKWLSVLSVLYATLSLPVRLWGSRAVYALVAHEAPGMTPLMAAAMMGNINEALALIAAGADMSARNSNGRTAAQLAQLAGLPPTQVGYMLATATEVLGRDDSFPDGGALNAFMTALPSGSVVQVDDCVDLYN